MEARNGVATVQPLSRAGAVYQQCTNSALRPTWLYRP